MRGGWLRVWWVLAWLVGAGLAQAKGKVSLEGLDDIQEASVMSRLSIYLRREEPMDADTLARLHAQAVTEIQRALQPFGYYQVSVQPALDSRPVDADVVWEAAYRIERGTAWRWTALQIRAEGEGEALLKDTLAELPLQVGAQVNHGDYEAAKERLSQGAFQLGFLDAEFKESRLEIDIAAQQAHAVITLKTGPRYYFGKVTLQGQDKLDEAFLRRYLDLPEGQPFDPRKVLTSQFNLNDLDHFTGVQILPDRDNTDDQKRIPVTVNLALKKLRKFSAGFGYATDTGFRGVTGVDVRRTRRDGSRANVNVRLSQRQQALGAEYRIPIGNKAFEEIAVRGEILRDAFPDRSFSRQDRLTFSVSRSPGELRRLYYLAFEGENNNLEGVDNRSILTMPGLTLSRGFLDDAIYARQGFFASFDLHGAFEGALSSNSFIRTHINAKAALPLPYKQARLLARAELGLTYVEEFVELPASQRFFAGGDASVRGYAFRELGPIRNGKVVGGRFLNTYSIEAELPVYGNFGSAIFLDAGGVSNRPSPDLNFGAGLGFRYRAPFGSVAVDLARPIKAQQQSVRLHLGVRVGL
jgi:translocation and assembly module TamA